MALKALLLIGGFGTRLRPITYSVPKQLIPIAGKPVLYHVLDLLPPDIEEVVLATGYKAEAIAAYVAGHPTGYRIRTVAESSPLGSGGAMKFAGGDTSDPFFLLNTDVVAEIDLEWLRETHERQRALGVLGLVEVDDPRPYGVAALDGDQIRRFVEKPTLEEAPSHWINAGVAIWSRSVLEAIPPGRPVGFEKEVLPGLLDRGVYGYRMSGFWEDAGTPERLLHAQRLLFDGGRAWHPGRPRGATGSALVCCAEDADVTGADLGEYVTVGAGVRIGKGACLTNSVVMDGADIGRDAKIAGSIVGPGMRIADGAQVTDQVVAEAPPP